MRILSFDVGIKNLAYCLINKNEVDFKVEDWGIINLDDERKKCTFILKNKKPCCKNALYSYMKDENKEYFCKKHKSTYDVPTVKTHDCSNNEKCSHKNKNDIVCNKKAKSIIEGTTIPLCSAHIKTEINSILKDMGPKKMSNQNCNKIPLQILSTKLFSTLDMKKNFLEVDEVLIENQPTLINPTMKTISTFLYSYFCLRGIVEKKDTRSNIHTVNFFSPSNKLKVNKQHSENILKKGENHTEVYDITKELGEFYCKALIKEDVDKFNFLNSQVKKDDLCDSFLQGFFYLYCSSGKIVPPKYKTILDNVSSEVKTLTQLKQNNKKKRVDKNKEQKNDIDNNENIGTINIKEDCINTNVDINIANKEVNKNTNKKIVVKGKKIKNVMQ